MSAMSDRMRDSPIRQAMQAIRDDSEQNLKEVRHSFITTPMRVYNILIEQATPPGEPLTWLAIFKLCAFLTWYSVLTIASLGVIYAFAFVLTAVANLSKTDGESADYRLRRPRPDQVQAIATLLGIVHISVVFTLAVLFGFDPPVSYPILIASSLASIGVLFFGIVFGGVILVAAWKLFKGTCERLYWPSERELPGAGDEKAKQRAADGRHDVAIVDGQAGEGAPTEQLAENAVEQ
ncbi:hypothetical protein LTR36_009399 [Oleoguttula mirabilis]|uniref:Uncharacterized protein n=1 Tax=Oleoguttula mirabilis TaxID=1507867 RepID=A0AAV9JSJ5_9PEZI|nr:hypothetical protein LTR36_009399 [Oleoguttula mirabilis]